MKRKIFLTLLLSSLLLIISCGKKGPLQYPGERARPKFDKIIDEE